MITADAADEVHRTVSGGTIPKLLRRSAREFPGHPALTSGITPDATTMTYAQLRAEVTGVALGLSALGLGPGERMLIQMAKRPEHWAVDLAAAHLGTMSSTVYDTLSTEEICFIAEHSGARVVVLEGAEQLQRWEPIFDELPQLRAVVVVDDSTLLPNDARFVRYSALRPVALPEHERAEFERWTDAVTPDQPLTVVYTSGTTGDPKGVVLSHRNVVHEATSQDHLAPVPEHPRSIAYLPLAHIAERVLGIYMPLVHAGHVTICPDPDQLLATLVAVRPNGLFGVPRVWEKIAAGLQAKLDEMPDEQGILKRARELSSRVLQARSRGGATDEATAAEHTGLDEQVLGPIRSAIGLDEAARTFSGAAPIPTSVLEFLASLGIAVHEVWGLSETTGAATANAPDDFVLGRVGKPLPGVEVSTGDDGELFVRGPVVTPGYLRPDGGIEPATDEDGWLPTGDVGAVDERGFVAVTDRKKELIITAGGKNIAPTRIEGLLRAHPLISQAVAIGDQRRYVTALIVLDEQAGAEWAKARGIDATDPADLAAHPDVLAEIESAVAAANDSLARVEQIKRHRVLDHPWIAGSAVLTPKLSLRRRAIHDRYRDEIEQLYP